MDTDMAGVLIAIASVEARQMDLQRQLVTAEERETERLKSITDRLDERHEALLVRLEERHDAREAFQTEILEAVREVRQALDPMRDRVEALEQKATKLTGMVLAASGVIAAVAWALEHFGKFFVGLMVAMTVACATVGTPPEGPRWCVEELPAYVLIDDGMSAECAAAATAGVEWWRAKGVQVVAIRGAGVRGSVRPRTIQVFEGELAAGVTGSAQIARLTPECILGGQVVVTECRTQTFAHELGHTLGLDHVDDPSNLMYFAADIKGGGPWGLTPEQLDHVR